MKKTIVVAMVFAAFMAGSGCIKDKEKDFAEDQVSFSANTGALETRTDYGEDGSVGGTSVTYVNWVEGDRIRILSSTGSTDTYTVSEVHDGSDSQGIGISKGNVNPDNDGIAWGTGVQTFYAMYPANVSGSSLTSSAMICVVPVKWTPASETELGQLPYGYMFAKETTSRTTSVSLTFNAKFTSFTFTLKNPTTSPVTLSSLSLSSASKAMSGTFTVNPSSGAIASLPDPGDNKSVTVDFTSLTDGGLVIPARSQDTDTPGTKTFTIVTLPDSYSDLTVTVSQGTDQNAVSKLLKLGKTNAQKEFEWIEFDAGKKHNISITLPEFANWTYSFSVENPTGLVASANGSSSNNGSVTSYKTKDNGTTKTALPWKVEGYYSTYESALNGVTTGTTKPTWLYTDIASSQTPVWEQPLSISYSNSTVENQSTGLKSVIDTKIAQTPSVGSSQAPINLADAAHGTGTVITESANCYIVNGPGYYKLPIVMGNGIMNNAINTDQYSYKGGTPGTADTKAYTRLFYKYDQVIIDSPILPQPDGAVTIWSDTGITIDKFNYADYTTVNSTNVYWLKFHVGASGQGNAIIAVKDGSNVMWSYHIWVTDSSFIMDNDSNIGFPLGWVSTEGSRSRIQGNTVYLRLRQYEEDGLTPTQASPVVLSLIVSDGDWSEGNVSAGYAPYYQWGRKDPIKPNISSDDYSFSVFQHNTALANDASKNYYLSILNPGDFIQYTISAGNQYFLARYSWIGGKYTNLNYWCAGIDGTTISTVYKTIFDPCPAGYTVPSASFLNTNHLSSKISLSSSTTLGYRYQTEYDKSDPYGTVKQSSALYLWSAAPAASVGNGPKAKRISISSPVQSTSSVSSAEQNHGDALYVLPMKNSAHTTR